jgi:hypothetical protein
MLGLEEIAVVIVGVLLRFAIPIALTMLAVWFFRRLDRRWQAEAQERARLQIAMAAAGRTPCWEQKQCSPAQREKCPVYGQQGVPCWQVFRDKDGNLKPTCLDCGVFVDAPVSTYLQPKG